MRKNQDGIVLLIIVSIAIIASAVALVSWRVIDANSKAETKESFSSKQKN